MDAKNKLLDAAKQICLSDSATAKRLGVTRQTVSHWRSGRYPMPEEQITAIAALAHESPEKWLVLIAAEQSQGATHRAWKKAAERLGIAACLTILLGTFAAPAHAFSANSHPERHGEYALCELVIRLFSKMREIVTATARGWTLKRSLDNAPSPLLA